MTTTNRFDPTPGEPNGHCLDCAVVFNTEADGDQHISQTMGGPTGQQKSHTITRTNPDRGTRVFREIAEQLQDGLRDAFNEIERLVDNDDITEDEADEAVRQSHINIEDEWQRYNS